MIALTGRPAGRARTVALLAEIEATPLHVLLSGLGFRLRPFRLPAGLARGELRLRLTWKKADGAQVQTIRLTHVVAVPVRAE